MALFIRHVRAVLFTGLVLSLSASVWAQDTQQQPPPPPTPPASNQTPPPPPAATPTPTPDPSASKPEPANPDDKNRIFGVLPNYNTVEGEKEVEPITSGKSFKIAAQSSFDPMVWPLFSVIAGVSQVQNEPASYGQTWSGYAKRYGLAFTDNTVCSLVTTGLLPSIFKQDPRYYQGRTTGIFNRMGYAASRSVVTKSRSGHPQFNISEIGGTLVVANVGNLYYPEDERTAVATLERWGMQTMWDTVANELKEFWPDIRHVMHER